MKKALILLMAAALTTRATQIQFALSPSGTDAAVGLSASNEVPAVTNSAGSGNVVGGGIVFDTTTGILHLEVGFGSLAGFSNLSGAPIAIHLHSPAPPGSNAPVLVNLLPFLISSNTVLGGEILADISYPTNSIADLLAGLTYLNIHTVLNQGGEVRAQLIPLASGASNSPPSITCPDSSTSECGTASTVSIQVSDPDNDALTVVWSVNGTAFQTNSIAAGGTLSGTNLSFIVTLPLGTNSVSITATDSSNNSASCATVVTVVDTTPPVIANVTATPNSLWPPNHKLIQVQVHADVTDTCGPATWKIISVSSNEAEDAKGSGHTAPDFKINGDHKVLLRAERSGNGNGRIYTITIQATDVSGNTSRATVTVTVPHDKSNKPTHPGNNSHGNNSQGNNSQGNNSHKPSNVPPGKDKGNKN